MKNQKKLQNIFICVLTLFSFLVLNAVKGINFFSGVIIRRDWWGSIQLIASAQHGRDFALDMLNAVSFFVRNPEHPVSRN